MHKIETKIFLFFAFLASVFLFNNCSGSKSDLTPNNTVLLTPPAGKVGINTELGWSDSPFISRDGKRLYFMYSRYNFATYIKSRAEGGTIVLPSATGPDRPGLHKNNVNAWDESDYYVSTKNADGSWSEPLNLGLNGDYADSSGMEINNGNTFVWLHGDGAGHNDLVIANKNADGSWGAPTVLGGGINDHSANVRQDNPHISPDGKGLWFLSDRAGGLGGTDLWFSFNTTGSPNGPWSAPVNLGAPFNTSGDDDQFWISPVSNDVYWNGPQGIMHCVSNGSSCAAAPTVVHIPNCDYPAEVSMPDDMQTMYFGCGNLTDYHIKIMYSVKQSDGSWGPATPVD